MTLGVRIVAAFSLVLLAAPGRGAEPSKDDLEFFEKKIRPVLARSCYSCHAGNVQAKGGLRVDTRAGLAIGGQNGPAVVPGEPKKGTLLAALRHDGPEMPPAGKLPDDVIADFARWVEIGAPDPRVPEAKPVSRGKYDYEEARKEWAYQTPKKSPVPELKGDTWAATPVDRFVRAKQLATGTTPVADAGPVVWLRRVTFDLVGLPPTPEQVAAVERDASAKARERIVDQLLASPQFGERWGRHWLDVARYAESTGKERNFAYAQAWRYRDWVIDAVNADKPFDRFVREQVAGDLLPAATPAERDALRIATGFLALGPKGINERNRESFLLDVADEQIENIGRGVLGLSVGCARCHDHKFDPIPAADYYAIAGILRSTDTRAGIQNRTRAGGQPELLVALSGASTPDPKLVAEVARLEKEWTAKRDELRRLRPEVAAGEPAAAPGDAKPGTTPAVIDALRAKQQEVQAAVQRLDQAKAKLAAASAAHTAIGVADRAAPQDIAVRVRGEADNLGPVVPRGFLTLINLPKTPAIPETASGRRELAEWLTRPDHPLTARVAVNRIWAKLFGVGLVPTVDDFGDQGQKVTHPELLDYLAVTFVERGWSVKQTVRELVLSRTYQLAGADDEANLARDEANVSLWRWNRKRLDAEALRDAALAAGGRLDLTRPVGSPVAELGARELGANADFRPVQRPSRHRSVYLPVLRNRPPEALALFDLPDPSLVAGQRETTTSPNQALYLLNGAFALEQSEHLARRLLAGAATDEARVERAYLAVLGRSPTRAERDRVLKFLAEWPAKDGDTSEARDLAAWTAVSQALLALPEFRFLF
ncbi:PSD1 and planctomycete cytochrome C domain-containing protein [Gemmata sp.]|uniref:PSD1 and planctomycete cytochrome C domain-containing protein n=1 Tax=Gemmata sp. TaxID=1914242 RepID=UPI003F70DA69